MGNLWLELVVAINLRMFLPTAVLINRLIGRLTDRSRTNKALLRRRIPSIYEVIAGSGQYCVGHDQGRDAGHGLG